MSNVQWHKVKIINLAKRYLFVFYLDCKIKTIYMDFSTYMALRLLGAVFYDAILAYFYIIHIFIAQDIV
nr:MAG TPA: hypothetical protein [Caudoviricetes sp.]